MTPIQIKQLSQSYHALGAMKPDFAHFFFTRLLSTAPELRGLLNSKDHDNYRKLSGMLNTAVNSLDNVDGLNAALASLGKRYQAQGINAKHYDAAKQALLETLDMALGDKFNAPTQAVWQSFCDMIKETTLAAHYSKKIEHCDWGHEVPMALTSIN
ncbi:MAG: hemoglobin-like flavoprotein [Zhongshania sp.]|jgi:hemoglobin-like flavoprotein